MTNKERKSCIQTIELLRRLAFNVHGVMDVIDNQNCDKIIEMLNKPETHWIPCTPETMPDTNRDVLLQFDNSMGVGFWEHNSWGINTGDNIYSEIGEREAQPIAWRELPESYQPEEE